MFSVNNNNVILITVEMLRPDYTSFFGNTAICTPNIDKLASKGISFTKAFCSSPLTPASLKSIQTSTYPFMHNGTLSPTEETVTLAEVLQEEGYHTVGIVDWPWLSPVFNWDRGFDVYTEDLHNKTASSDILPLRGIRKIWEKGESFLRSKLPLLGDTLNLMRRYYDHRTTKDQPKAFTYSEKASEWIEEHLEEKYFLWIHYPDTHLPYYPLPPSKYLPSYTFYQLWKAQDPITTTGEIKHISKDKLRVLIDLYKAEIKVIDKSIQKLITTLEKYNQLSNTYIFLMGDHGEQFMEHGELGHMYHLYNEAINVPLLISNPTLENKKIETPVSLIDIAPTILDLLELERNDEFLGKSLLKQENRKESAKEGIICEAPLRGNFPLSLEECFNMRKVKFNKKRVQRALITGKWKYIFRNKGKDELYNLQRDFTETKNLLHEEEAVAERLRNKIRDHINFEEKTVSLKEKIRERVKQLRG